MTTQSKLFFKTFIITGLTFGLLITLWDYYDKGNIFIVKTIVEAVLFGALMGWRSVVNQKKSLKEKEAKSTKE